MHGTEGTFKGKVFAVIPSDPWQWVVPLRGVNLRPGALVCHLSLEGGGAALEVQDWESLFQEGVNYALQVEGEGPHPLSVSVSARLSRRLVAPTGLELGFALPPDSEIDAWFKGGASP